VGLGFEAVDLGFGALGLLLGGLWGFWPQGLRVCVCQMLAGLVVLSTGRGGKSSAGSAQEFRVWL